MKTACKLSTQGDKMEIKNVVKMLTNEELARLLKEQMLQMECLSLMDDNPSYMIVRALKLTLKLSEVRAKDIEFTAVQRINSILDLCHGKA